MPVSGAPLIAVLSLIPNYAVRITLTAILTTLAFVHTWVVHSRPLALLGTLQAAITAAERIIGEAQAHHVLDVPTLARYSLRLIQYAKRRTSIARCSVMKLSIVHCVQYYRFWRQLRQCMTEAQEITDALELLIETNRQETYTALINYNLNSSMFGSVPRAGQLDSSV
ncbi:hypothetical protein C8F01DRAFT_1158056 [Mycena amicta]|nr:hypothetical protein C8F01DRAFT_1158056 [Mycena amicta]